MTAQPQKRPRWRRILFELLKTTLQVLVLFLALSALIGRFEIHQDSMEPTFHEGQRVIVSKLDNLWENVLVNTAHAASHGSSPFAPRRGQLVVFTSPNGLGAALIKRVVGLPGDTIEVRDKSVWIDGRQLDEPYVVGRPTLCSRGCGATRLGAGTYYLLGDNRPNSLDSRIFGPVSGDRIIGRVVMRYWPLNQIEIYP
jgi:signal peptidase I